MKNFEEFTTTELKAEIKRREKDEKLKSNSNLLPITIEFIKEIKDALKEFGSYTFMDKGPDEVMNMVSLERKLKDLDIKTIATILTQCLDSKDVKEDYTHSFVESIISGLDDRDDFEELFDFDNRFEY